MDSFLTDDKEDSREEEAVGVEIEANGSETGISFGVITTRIG
jgi:hypothetical protein